MLRYHVAFYLPKADGAMVVAEALDFPGAVSQGFDLPDARAKGRRVRLGSERRSALKRRQASPVPTLRSGAVDADSATRVDSFVSEVSSVTNTLRVQLAYRSEGPLRFEGRLWVRSRFALGRSAKKVKYLSGTKMADSSDCDRLGVGKQLCSRWPQTASIRSSRHLEGVRYDSCSGVRRTKIGDPGSIQSVVEPYQDGSTSIRLRVALPKQFERIVLLLACR